MSESEDNIIKFPTPTTPSSPIKEEITITAIELTDEELEYLVEEFLDDLFAQEEALNFVMVGNDNTYLDYTDDDQLEFDLNVFLEDYDAEINLEEDY